MQPDNAVFVGIVPTAREQTTPYALLDSDLNLISLAVRPWEEIIAELVQLELAAVGICGPKQPNWGLMRNSQFRQALKTSPRSGTWNDVRVVEYLLYLHGIRMPQTRLRRDDCPAWMQTSFDFFSQLSETGYKQYPQNDAPRQMLETNANACFAVLLNRLTLTKTSLEGRFQRQLILYDLELQIPDPMRVFEEITRYRLLQGILDLDGLYTSQELDALVSAFTAWRAIKLPQKSTRIGDHKEGQIVLPVKGLKNAYT